MLRARYTPSGSDRTTHTSPVKRTSSSSATNGFETAEAFRGQTNTQHAVNYVAGQIYTFRVRSDDTYKSRKENIVVLRYERFRDSRSVPRTDEYAACRELCCGPDIHLPGQIGRHIQVP